MLYDIKELFENAYKKEMIIWVEKHPERFAELTDLAMESEYPSSWRAAWLLWSCMNKNDLRLQKYIDKIISILPQKTDQHCRELLKVLYLMELNEEQEGKLLSFCMAAWENIKKSHSVRYNAFKTLVKISEKYPELKRELVLLTDKAYTNNLSEGIRRSLLKMLD